MIELRTFDGTPVELADFCTGVWRAKYANTEMPVPMWSAEFLEWELFRETPEEREFLVAAYHGTKLVGVLPCRPMQYQLHGERVFGTLGSYFSVDPDYSTEGVAMKLNLEQIRRHRQRGAKFLMGFVYLGASSAKGKEFWLRQPRTMNVVSKLGLWVRILDHKVVGRFERSALNRLGVRSLGVFQRSPKSDDSAQVRLYQARDLPDCLRLANELTEQADFGMVWDEALLGRQLDHEGVPHTLVAEEEGRVAGLLNYWKLDLLHFDDRGTDSMKGGIIDLLHVDHLSSKTAKQLLNTALRQMQDAGCHVAMVLRVPDAPGMSLLKRGFLMQPPEYYFTAQEMAPGVKFPADVKSLHVPYR